MTKSAAADYKFVGRHVDDLADGRTLAPGQTVRLTDGQVSEPHNQRLLNEGLLIPTKKKED